MIRKLAIGISAVMHPLLITTYLFALLFFYASLIAQPMSATAAQYILLALFITTFVLPIICIVALRFSALRADHRLSAFSLSGRRERIVPFFFTGVFYIITTYMFAEKFRVNLVLVVILAAITALILLVSTITLFAKVSAHAAGGGALVGFLIGLSVQYPQVSLLMPILLAVVLTGSVMSSRLYLNLQSAASVWGGVALGFVISLSAVLLFVA